MKHPHILLLLLYSLLVGCSQKNTSEKNTEPENFVIISGKAADSILPKLNKAVTFIYQDLARGHLDKVVELDSLGQFRIEITTTDPTEFTVFFGDSFKLLAEPGDSIHLSFNSLDLDRSDYKVISGDHSERNQTFNDLHSNYSPDWKRFEQIVKSKSMEDFITYVDSLDAARDNYLEKFLNVENGDDLLENWIRTERTINGIVTKQSYPMYDMMFNRRPADSIPKSFYKELIDPIDIADLDLTNASLIERFPMYYMYNIRNWIQVEHETNNSGEVIDSIYFQEMIRLHEKSPLQAQIATIRYIASDFDNNELDRVKKFRSALDTIITNEDIKAYIRTSEAEIVQRLKNPVLPENSEILEFETSDSSSYLEEIIAKADGKIIYIDHWATWCGPCKAEFKRSTPELKKKFSDQVEFVYLCYQSKKDLWLPSISQFKIEGKHYFIEDEASKILKEQVDLIGFPTYTIIDSQGIIVNSGFEYRPSQAITTEILTELIEKNDAK